MVKTKPARHVSTAKVSSKMSMYSNPSSGSPTIASNSSSDLSLQIDLEDDFSETDEEDFSPLSPSSGEHLPSTALTKRGRGRPPMKRMRQERGRRSYKKFVMNYAFKLFQGGAPADVPRHLVAMSERLCSLMRQKYTPDEAWERRNEGTYSSYSVAVAASKPAKSKRNELEPHHSQEQLQQMLPQMGQPALLFQHLDHSGAMLVPAATTTTAPGQAATTAGLAQATTITSPVGGPIAMDANMAVFPMTAQSSGNVTAAAAATAAAVSQQQPTTDTSSAIPIAMSYIPASSFFILVSPGANGQFVYTPTTMMPISNLNNPSNGNSSTTPGGSAAVAAAAVAANGGSQNQQNCIIPAQFQQAVAQLGSMNILQMNNSQQMVPIQIFAAAGGAGGSTSVTTGSGSAAAALATTAAATNPSPPSTLPCASPTICLTSPPSATTLAQQQQSQQPQAFSSQFSPSFASPVSNTTTNNAAVSSTLGSFASKLTSTTSATNAQNLTSATLGSYPSAAVSASSLGQHHSPFAFKPNSNIKSTPLAFNSAAATAAGATTTAPSTNQPAVAAAPGTTTSGTYPIPSMSSLPSLTMPSTSASSISGPSLLSLPTTSSNNATKAQSSASIFPTSLSSMTQPPLALARPTPFSINNNNISNNNHIQHHHLLGSQNVFPTSR